MESIRHMLADFNEGRRNTEGEIKKNRIAQAKALWKEFGDIPMNPGTEYIEEKGRCFLAGTHREKIWHWFEETFGVSVAEDLMGL